MKSLFKNLHLFSIRKLTIGTASVMLGSLFILGGSHNAHAAENESTINDESNLEVQQKETIENESNNENPIKTTSQNKTLETNSQETNYENQPQGNISSTDKAEEPTTQNNLINEKQNQNETQLQLDEDYQSYKSQDKNQLTQEEISSHKPVNNDKNLPSDIEQQPNTSISGNQDENREYAANNTSIDNKQNMNSSVITQEAGKKKYGSAKWLTKHKISYGFGRYNLPNNGGQHYGVDFVMPVGTPVKAVTGGKVLNASWDPMGGGNTLTIQEPDGKHTQFYMHLNKFNVSKGQNIKTGQVIAHSGNTGNTTGPHLHFQRMNGTPSNQTAVNPLPFLKSIGYGKKTSGKNPSTSNGFKTNKYGTLYKSEKASFTPNTNIITRKTGPFRSMKQAGILKAGKKINYDEVMKQDGYVWLGYGSKKNRKYVPIRTWNRNTNAMGPIWGKIS
ncbi:peptidoglycan DD-metalloendopeptidase family protein [Staphylococcus pettenkoferi]|uniref:peptidoglycan DD-metalloendopeptidase family protein n=1 Tax=Staphylococcus pettenkoferi TaxID=170573 RepID=UPI00227291A9|nr:peptidoglycan DD-metalloendopeptidase family protein [Staphylococcus pettenkoferi]MCY1620801.1 peptidoglycan DD-metalloendopeptidase family protein [Staphylococcus pettenkoferi]